MLLAAHLYDYVRAALLVLALWCCAALASHAWHTVKIAMMRRLGRPRRRKD